MMDPSPPWATRKSLEELVWSDIAFATYRKASKGYVQVTSELRTKKGESSLPRMSRASARGPAEDVSMGFSVGIEGYQVKAHV